jgi:hypothetical protein
MAFIMSREIGKAINTACSWLWLGVRKKVVPLGRQPGIKNRTQWDQTFYPRSNPKSIPHPILSYLYANTIKFIYYLYIELVEQAVKSGYKR